MSEVSVIGLDLAKHVFQVLRADASGRVVLRKQLRRTGAGVLWPVDPVRGSDGGLFWR